MDKRITGVVICVLLCTAGVAQGQLHKTSKQSLGTGPDPRHGTGADISFITPQNEARGIRMGQLRDAAAAALDAGRYDEAETEAREALSLRPDSGVAQEVFASSLNAQGKTQEALQAYKVMADHGGVFPRNMLPYALLLLKTGHWPQAVAAYNKQLRYLADGDLMVANSHFSPAEPQPRELATAIHIALGLTYGSSATWGGHSQGDKALAHFQQALTLSPDSALAHLYCGRQLQRIGRKAEAQNAFKKAAELGNSDVKAAAEQALK